MNLRDITKNLAFQVDRKILGAEEENHIRMDIPAHERLRTFKVKKPSGKSGFKSFTFTTAIIFIGLFLLTNLPAYSKIFMASIESYKGGPSSHPGAERDVGTQNAAGVQSGAETNGPSDGGEAGVLVTGKQEDTEKNEDLEADGQGEEMGGIMKIDITPTPYEDQIEVPSIKVNARIVEPELGLESLLSGDWNELESQIRDSLLRGIVHYPGTADPGEKGNFFVTGHSSNVFWEKSPYNTVFALLPRIEIGADIYVTYDQKNYHYRVVETKEVSPKNISILEQGNDEKMTLMTCTPVGTTLRRFVVIAEPVE